MAMAQDDTPPPHTQFHVIDFPFFERIRIALVIWV
jgi:hypothetical protein